MLVIIGLGLGTNDASTFKTALTNLGIAAGISIHGRKLVKSLEAK